MTDTALDEKLAAARDLVEANIVMGDIDDDTVVVTVAGLIGDIAQFAPSPSQVAPQPQAGKPALHSPYMRIVTMFDRDETAASFLSEDGDGGFAGGVYRMAREIDRLRALASPQPANPAQVTDADLTAHLKEIAVEVFPSANKFAVAEGVKNLIRILERIEPSEYAVLHRSMFPFSYDRPDDDGQPTEAQEWSDYDPYC